MLMPIKGYEKMPLVSLEEAVAPLISILPEIQDNVYVAKQRCKSMSPNGLTQDESASIMLYSMEWEPHEECLYFVLNATLRSEDRRRLKPWFSYLKLLLTALEKLPSTRCHVFRGVNLDLTNQYTEGKTFVWWGFSSCTTSIGVFQENEQFLGKTGQRTLFTIECDSGKDISRYSYYQKEKEVLLLAARQFIVVAYLQPATGLHMIQLKETKPPITLLQPATNHSVQIQPLPSFTEEDVAQTTVVPVPPKINNSKDDASYITKDLPKPAYEITKPNELPESKFNKWKQDAITVAGTKHWTFFLSKIVNTFSGNGAGYKLNQLKYPHGIFIDKKKNIFIADYSNHRIVEWKYNANEGQIIAGGNGQGNRMDQLNNPTDVIVDQQNHSIIIADWGNRRVIQWLNQNQQILIDNIDCSRLAMDKYGYVYVSDHKKNEVRRWKMGEYNNEGIIVAGGNRKGEQLNQLHSPNFIFVDEEQSVYASDRDNHRVMKWRRDAKEGRIVAGGNGKGEKLNQLSKPQGIMIDHLGQIYVADELNHRIMRWCEGKEEGEIVVGGNGEGHQSNQLDGPGGLSFDDEGNLYVADFRNHRIQKYEKI
ncbi:unnamed protein product [Adineta steineri]|uniref:NAD(P)(+)--arginine ADP-ribosyltransferase n=1 Tax=Adineta steineri TaxID=433720 RepID=A0A815DQP4_9BILA|nr:unnamed protein product [Adineta steineri]CAF1303287.1 unnamed protein product [Adineta steineri]CAF1304332.1 unnamed protein product [Adineta steineri]